MDTTHVDRAEWRWVTFISITFLLIAFLPFILIAILNPPDDQWQFLGVLHDYQDGAASLSRIQQGADGQILVYFLHTPEAHESALIQPLYVLLGQLSRLSHASPILIFHLVRMIAALFMYLMIYQLGAAIWTKIRTRRIFFVIASLGSGLGWVYALLTGLSQTTVIPDLMLPQIYPFYSATVNIHYPLALACLSLLGAVMVEVFRPGSNELPSIKNGGTTVFLAGLGLAFVYPDALLPLSLAFLGSAIAKWGHQGRLVLRELRWGLWMIAPALPVISYNILTAVSNPFVASWLIQRAGNSPSLPFLLLGLGLPFVLALPGFYRAFRYFEADGDRFFLLWFLAMVITLYLPIYLNQYVLVGMMLPIAYFAARSLEDFWFGFIKRRYRGAIYVLGVLAMLLSQVLWLFLPVLPIIEGWSNVSANVLEQGYTDTFEWLALQRPSQQVVLAAPEVGAWIPVWAKMRPVYGHPYETYESEQKAAEILAWYQADRDDPICQDFVARYKVRYILLGFREQRLGQGACTANFTLVASSDNVLTFSTESSSR